MYDSHLLSPDHNFLLTHSTKIAVCGQTWFIFLTPPIFFQPTSIFHLFQRKNPKNPNGSKEPPRVTQRSSDMFLVVMKKMSMPLERNLLNVHYSKW